MKYLLVECLPQARVVVATLCDADRSVLAEYALECCDKCAIQGCLNIAVIDQLIGDQEQIQVRALDQNQDAE